MPSKGKGNKLEAKTSASTSSKGGAPLSKRQQQKQEEDTLDLDEIARACLEIEQQMARQESRPKNRKKKAARQKNEVGGKAKNKEEEEEGGEGVQQLSELNMSGETKGEVTRLTELIKISVEVSCKENHHQIMELHRTKVSSLTVQTTVDSKTAFARCFCPTWINLVPVSLMTFWARRRETRYILINLIDPLASLVQMFFELNLTCINDCIILNSHSEKLQNHQCNSGQLTQQTNKQTQQ